MTAQRDYQRDQLQALIAEIDGMLSKASPKLPWVMSNETTQQRKLLERTRQYLVQLQQSPVATMSAEVMAALERGDLSPLSDIDAPQTADSPRAILQALLEEMQYLRTHMLQPMRSEVASLFQERETLLAEVRRLEMNRLQLEQDEALTQARSLEDLFDALSRRLETQVTGQIEAGIRRLESEVTAPYLLGEGFSDQADQQIGAGKIEGPRLTPAERLAYLKRIQSEADRLVLNLDQSLRAVFESLQNNLRGYQDSLEQGLDTMHTLGGQGEMMIEVLVSHLAQQIGRHPSAYLGSPEAGEGRYAQLPTPRQVSQPDDLSDSMADRVSEASVDEGDWSLEDLNLGDLDFEDDEDITLLQIDQQITQLQLDQDEEDGDIDLAEDEEPTLLQIGSNESDPESPASDLLDPLNVLQQLDEAQPDPDARIEPPQPDQAEPIQATPIFGEEEIEGEQDLDELYESLFGEASPNLTTPMADAETETAETAFDVEPADDSWGTDTSTAETTIPLSPETTSVPPEASSEQKTDGTDTIDNLILSEMLVASDITAPASAAAASISSTESTEQEELEADYTLETVFGEGLTDDLAPAEVAKPGSETVSSLAEVLPDSEIGDPVRRGDTDQAGTVQSLEAGQSMADIRESQDTFIAASPDEDLLARDEEISPPLQSLGQTFDDESLEQLAADLLNMEAQTATDQPSETPVDSDELADFTAASPPEEPIDADSMPESPTPVSSDVAPDDDGTDLFGGTELTEESTMSTEEVFEELPALTLDETPVDDPAAPSFATADQATTADPGITDLFGETELVEEPPAAIPGVMDLDEAFSPEPWVDADRDPAEDLSSVDEMFSDFDNTPIQPIEPELSAPEPAPSELPSSEAVETDALVEDLLGDLGLKTPDVSPALTPPESPSAAATPNAADQVEDLFGEREVASFQSDQSESLELESLESLAPESPSIEGPEPKTPNAGLEPMSFAEDWFEEAESADSDLSSILDALDLESPSETAVGESGLTLQDLTDSEQPDSSETAAETAVEESFEWATAASAQDKVGSAPNTGAVDFDPDAPEPPPSDSFASQPDDVSPFPAETESAMGADMLVDLQDLLGDLSLADADTPVESQPESVTPENLFGSVSPDPTEAVEPITPETLFDDFEGRAGEAEPAPNPKIDSADSDYAIDLEDLNLSLGLDTNDSDQEEPSFDTASDRSVASAEADLFDLDSFGESLTAPAADTESPVPEPPWAEPPSPVDSPSAVDQPLSADLLPEDEEADLQYLLDNVADILGQQGLLSLDQPEASESTPRSATTEFDEWLTEDTSALLSEPPADEPPPTVEDWLETEWPDFSPNQPPTEPPQTDISAVEAPSAWTSEASDWSLDLEDLSLDLDLDEESIEGMTSDSVTSASTEAAMSTEADRPVYRETFTLAEDDLLPDEFFSLSEATDPDSADAGGGDSLPDQITEATALPVPPLDALLNDAIPDESELSLDLDEGEIGLENDSDTADLLSPLDDRLEDTQDLDEPAVPPLTEASADLSVEQLGLEEAPELPLELEQSVPPLEARAAILPLEVPPLEQRDVPTELPDEPGIAIEEALSSADAVVDTPVVTEASIQDATIPFSPALGPEAPTPRDQGIASIEGHWFLGIDLGTTGLSAVLLNQEDGQVYPLYWVDTTVSGATAEKFFRLPILASVKNPGDLQQPWSVRSVGASALTVNWAEADPFSEDADDDEATVLLKSLKPFLRLGIPHQVPGTDDWEPVLQWSDTLQVPLQAVQSSLEALLGTLLGSTASLQVGAVGNEEGFIRAALHQLQGVIVSYPANWPDTYSFNLREAILGAGLILDPGQIYFIEDAITAVLSGLPDPANLSDDPSTQPLRQQTLYGCDWGGGTVVISAGACLTELAVVNLPRDLRRLAYDDFALTTLAYGGDALDLDIIAHLLHPPERRQTRGNASTGERQSLPHSGWAWQASLPELEQTQWSELDLEGLELPRPAEPDVPLRQRLQQRLETSMLGQSVLEAARHVKLILQNQNQFDLHLADQHWSIRRRDLESRIVLPYIQRLNGQINRLISVQGLSTQGINQVICTGGTASLPSIARWLRQKFPNATIIQDTYPSNRPPSCSRIAYGLVNLVRYPKVLDLVRHQYSDNFLLMELLRVMPDQPMPLDGILHLLQEQGLNVAACETHLIALLEGRLPPGLAPTSESPLIAPSLSEQAMTQSLTTILPFSRQSGHIYSPNMEQCQRLQTYLRQLLADKQQTLREPLFADLATLTT